MGSVSFRICIKLDNVSPCLFACLVGWLVGSGIQHKQQRNKNSKFNQKHHKPNINVDIDIATNYQLLLGHLT